MPVCERLVRRFLAPSMAGAVGTGNSTDDLSLTELIAIDFSAPTETLKELMAADDPWLVDFSHRGSPMALGPPPPRAVVEELQPAVGHTLDVQVFLSVAVSHRDLADLSQLSRIASTLRGSPGENLRKFQRVSSPSPVFGSSPFLPFRGFLAGLHLLVRTLCVCYCDQVPPTLGSQGEGLRDVEVLGAEEIAEALRGKLPLEVSRNFCRFFRLSEILSCDDFLVTL